MPSQTPYKSLNALNLYIVFVNQTCNIIREWKLGFFDKVCHKPMSFRLLTNLLLHQLLSYLTPNDYELTSLLES